MEKVIVSKDKCLHCLYGVSGVCEMYDEMAKPMDGETCYNYEEADDNEMADGQQYADIAPQLQEMSPLQCYKLGTMHGANTLVKQIWHKADEHPGNRHPYPVLNPDSGEMALAYYNQYAGWVFDRIFDQGIHMLWLDIEKILPKKEE